MEPDGAPRPRNHCPAPASLLYGDRGTVVALGAVGRKPAVASSRDDDLELYGALVDRVGIVLVGQRRSSPSLRCPSKLRSAARRRCERSRSPHKLRGVARLANGALLACGDDGALARIDTPTCAAIPWGRTGHLLAITARADGGAFAVGSGGHALSISPNLQANLEAVQTTRDLLYRRGRPGRDGMGLGAPISASSNARARRGSASHSGSTLDEKLSILDTATFVRHRDGPHATTGGSSKDDLMQ